MANINEVWGERETGNLIILKNYLGGYNVAGSASWVVDYYKGPYTNWQQILAKGNTDLIKRTTVTENELAYLYERLGYV